MGNEKFEGRVKIGKFYWNFRWEIERCFKLYSMSQFIAKLENLKLHGES